MGLKQVDLSRGYPLSLGTGNGPDWLLFQYDICLCSSPCNHSLTVIESISHDHQNRFSAYPKPFTDEVFFKVDSPGLIVISGLSGRKLKEIRTPGSSFHDAISWRGTDARGNKLAPGAYLAAFKGNHEQKKVKLLLQ